MASTCDTGALCAVCARAAHGGGDHRPRPAGAVAGGLPSLGRASGGSLSMAPGHMVNLSPSEKLSAIGEDDGRCIRCRGLQ